MRALLLVEHGSRQAESTEGLDFLIQAFRREGNFEIVERAFLELAHPTIPEAIAACVRQGVAHLVVVPYFLEKGRHVEKDIPSALQAARQAHPGLRIEMAQPLGAHPKLVDILRDRIEDIRGRKSVS